MVSQKLHYIAHINTHVCATTEICVKSAKEQTFSSLLYASVD